MRINETTLRRIIRTLLEADDPATGSPMTPVEAAAKAATNPAPEGPEKPTPAATEEDISPTEAFARALAHKMRKNGVPETTVTAMLDATKGSK